MAVMLGLQMRLLAEPKLWGRILKETGYTRATINNYIAGRRSPDLTTINALRRVVGMTYEEMTSPVPPTSRLSSSGAPASAWLGEEDSSMGEARRRIQVVIDRLQHLTDPGEMLQIADIIEVVISRCSHGARRREHVVPPAVADG